MKGTTNIFYKNRRYFFSFLTLLLTGTILLLINGKAALAVPLNNTHPFWLNVFFINYTFIGDGFFAIILIAVCFFYFKKKQEGLTLLNAIVLSGISIQLIKNFSSFANPTVFFEQGQYLFATDGISSINDPAIASGHTALAFAMATVLIGMMKNKKWQLFVLLAAALLGYSRIYLAQHSLLSVMIGAAIGTGFGSISLMLASARFKFNPFGKRKIRYAHRGGMAYE